MKTIAKGMTEAEREALHERAAIMEFDGGLDRRTATLRAFALYYLAEYAEIQRTAYTAPDGVNSLYAFLNDILDSPQTQEEAHSATQTTPNVVFNATAQTGTPKARYEGVAAVKHFTEHGIPIKDFYAKGADTDRTTYSTETLLEHGKKYKIYLSRRFLCLDIDRKPKDIEREGNRGDGLQNFHAWLESIGKTRELLPSYLRSIENGNFPCYMETPSGGLHLYFKYKGSTVSGALCPHVEIKTVQLSAGYKDGKPYVFIGDIDKAPNLPMFIRGRLPVVEKQTPRFIPLQQSKQYDKSAWEKIVEWTDADSKGNDGRNEYAFSLAVHAKTHQWTENETLEALQHEPRIDGLPETEIISAVKSAYRRRVA
jgi:hypothetical protein